MSSTSPAPQPPIHRDDSGVDMTGTDSTKDAPGSPERSNAYVRYRTEYRDRRTGELLTSRETETPPWQSTTEENEAADEPVFELVTTYQARPLEAGRQVDANKPGDEANRLAAATLTKPRYHVNIFSGAIANALQSVVEYYPGQSLTDDPIVVYWPYPVLVHHYDELAAFRDTAVAKDPADKCVMERDAGEHIELLLQFLDTQVMEGVRAEQERHKRGLYTWEYIWLYFKPGTTVMSKIPEEDPSEISAAVVHSVEFEEFEGAAPEYSLSLWTMEYNGVYLGRRKQVFKYRKFEGEMKKSWSLLDVSDMRRGEAEMGSLSLAPEAQRRIQYGKQFWNLLQKQCKHHRGKSREFPFNEFESLVMVDIKGYFEEQQGSRPETMGKEDCRPSDADGSCAFCKERKQKGHVGKTGVMALFEDYNNIYPDEELTNHQYLLCPAEIEAFVFKTRAWVTVHVKNLSEPEFDETMIDGLVMDKARKSTLMSLAKSFGRRNKMGQEMSKGIWTADFVQGKGSGLIFLLHGRPGVGKTCTAECIAASTRRPLQVITSSDIGTTPDVVESNLTRIFKTAVSWNTVLLIDEADVFMERRTTADLTRNSLVAGFLRALEHYDGILFLTTNRVGAFDDAFISRIHVQLFYPEFTDEQRQLVWKTFMDKLARERGDYIRLNIDAKEYIRGKEMRAVQWNGREIRNALQTAVALAEFDAEKDEEGTILITDAHLKAVVELSADFKTYLNDLHRGDEAKRAERKYERLDDTLRTPSKP
ncbi:hypothetical protein QBC39DRAFT_350605 [Podospora conica]|nr:hypothetical protein QBC39DRAFT_350605 [Schizothecium conicum]